MPQILGAAALRVPTVEVPVNGGDNGGGGETGTIPLDPGPDPVPTEPVVPEPVEPEEPASQNNYHDTHYSLVGASSGQKYLWNNGYGDVVMIPFGYSDQESVYYALAMGITQDLTFTDKNIGYGLPSSPSVPYEGA